MKSIVSASLSVFSTLLLLSGCQAKKASESAEMVQARKLKEDGIKWSQSGVWENSLPKLEGALANFPQDRQLLYHLILSVEGRDGNFTTDPRLETWALLLKKIAPARSQESQLARRCLVARMEAKLKPQLERLCSESKWPKVLETAQSVPADLAEQSLLIQQHLHLAGKACGRPGKTGVAYQSGRRLLEQWSAELGNIKKSEVETYVLKVEQGCDQPTGAIAYFWAEMAKGADPARLSELGVNEYPYSEYLPEAIKNTKYQVKGLSETSGVARVQLTLQPRSGKTGKGLIVLVRRDLLWKVDFGASRIGHCLRSLSDQGHRLESGRINGLVEPPNWSKIPISRILGEKPIVETPRFFDRSNQPFDFRYRHHKLTLFGTQGYRSGPVSIWAIHCGNPKYRTMEGLGVGDSLGSWKQFYPRVEKSDLNFDEMDMVTVRFLELEGRLGLAHYNMKPCRWFQLSRPGSRYLLQFSEPFSEASEVRSILVECDS